MGREGDGGGDDRERGTRNARLRELRAEALLQR